MIKNARTIYARTIYETGEIRIVDNLVIEYKILKNAWEKKIGKVESDKFIFDVHWYENGHRQFEIK